MNLVCDSSNVQPFGGLRFRILVLLNTLTRLLLVVKHKLRNDAFVRMDDQILDAKGAAQPSALLVLDRKMSWYVWPR